MRSPSVEIWTRLRRARRDVGGERVGVLRVALAHAEARDELARRVDRDVPPLLADAVHVVGLLHLALLLAEGADLVQLEALAFEVHHLLVKQRRTTVSYENQQLDDGVSPSTRVGQLLLGAENVSQWIILQDVDCLTPGFNAAYRVKPVPARRNHTLRRALAIDSGIVLDNVWAMAADKPAPGTDVPAAAAAAAAAAAKRDRSPNYPAITYSEAENHARKLWEADKRHPMNKDVASVHLGYTKSSGATMPLFAAMKRYGLLESVGTDLKVTDDAHFIFVHPEDAPERHEMRKKLAMMPQLFSEVLQHFVGGLPSDATLKAKLLTTFKFASPEAADTFIKALRESVAIAGESTVAGSVPGADNNAVLIKDLPMTTVHDLTLGAALPARPMPVVPLPLPFVQAPPGGQSRPWDLGGGVVVTVSMPNPSALSKRNIERLKRYVAALENEAAITWDDEDASSEFGSPLP